MTSHPFAYKLTAALFGGPIAVVSLVVASSETVAAPTPATLHCELHSKRVGDAVVLDGSVMSSVPLAGHYHLTVVSSGRGGPSNIAQSGDFEVAPGHPGAAGHVTVGGSIGAITATLSVTMAFSTKTCSTRLPSDDL